jgi:hypothetical protein
MRDSTVEHLVQLQIFWSQVRPNPAWPFRKTNSAIGTWNNNEYGVSLASRLPPMSQHAVEAALGKLICDEAFRREFYDDAEVAALRHGFQLTAIEIGSLRRIRISSIESLARHVNDRVKRAEAPKPQRRA